MGRQIFKALIILSAFIQVGCVKDKPGVVVNTRLPQASGNVYITCEGAYGTSADATLYAYSPSSDSVYGDIFQAVNTQPLGNVFQSMVRVGDKFFLSVNNSGKVVVIDAVTYEQTAVINIPYPRYILPLAGSKAYVSSLYSNKVYVINTQSYTLTDSIALPDKNAEGMCLYNNDAIICTWDNASNHIYRISTVTNKVVQSVKIAGYAPNQVLVDKEEMLWVLAGNSEPYIAPTWTRVDPSTGDILAHYNFPAGSNAIKATFNPTRDTLYYIEVNYKSGTDNNGIYRMGIHDGVLPVQPLIQAKAYQYFYALGISPETGYLFIGDPKGFSQKGTISVCKPDGTLLKSYSVGKGPGSFYFDE